MIIFAQSRLYAFLKKHFPEIITIACRTKIPCVCVLKICIELYLLPSSPRLLYFRCMTTLVCLDAFSHTYRNINISNLPLLVEPDGVCDINKGIDAAVVHGFPPEHAGFREVPQGAASVVLQVHRVNVRSEVKLASIVNPRTKLQVTRLLLVVVFTDGFEDHRGDPADVAVVLDHQVGSAAHQLLTKVSSDIVEQEDVWSPKLVWWQLDLGDPLVVGWVPLQVLIHPLEVEPNKGGKNAPFIVIFHNLFQHGLHIDHNGDTAVQHRDEHGVVICKETGHQPIFSSSLVACHGHHQEGEDHCGDGGDPHRARQDLPRQSRQGAASRAQ